MITLLLRKPAPMGALLLAWALLAPAAQRPPAAAVASAHAQATDAGMQVLAGGGNAFDAAVAVSAALAVVEPYSSGLGGGGFWLVQRAGGEPIMIDARERAPGAAGPDLYLDEQGEPVPGLSVDGPLAAGIPGTPAALDDLARHYGRLPLSRTLAPAIELAEKGFEVSPHYRRMATLRREVLARYPAAARVFLAGDEVPPLGHRIVQPELAVTLERLAGQGREGFYAGEVGRALVRGVREAGGIWTRQDLADYQVVERAPVTGRYHELRVVSAAPPSAGGIALVSMLNILAGYELDELEPAARKHLIVEAMRRAYHDRARYLGDPDHVAVPVARLTDPHYAAGLRAAIHPGRALPSAQLPGIGERAPDGPHTTHFSILDREGNRVAATLSINYPFGSGFMPAGTGVLLNDELDDFTTRPGVPDLYGLVGSQANAVGPGKRPVSSMSPTFVEGPRGLAILGTPGGSRIISMVLLAVLDHAAGGDPESWVSLPRFHHQYLPDEVQHEPGAFTVEEAADLAARGHVLRELGQPYGNMQAVFWDRRQNRVLAASDPRGEGAARVR